MGNIVKDSFAQSWKTLKEIPNVIEIQFMDKNKGYRQETVSFIDEEALSSGAPMRKSQVRLFTTRTSYAIRAARYALKVAKYINRSISFKAGIDAIACQAGDIISISHDVPQWGFSGRVGTGSTITLVKLDRTIVIEDGKSYKVRVRFSDDEIEERLITSPVGEYTEIECEAFTNVPQEYDVFAIGETNKVKKDFRVVSIKREGTNECQVQALEYNENVYDDSDIILPSSNYSSLSSEIPNVENLNLTESLVKKADGTIENAIDVWFTKPDVASHYVKTYARCKVYISDNDGSSWAFRGETTGTHFQVLGDIIDDYTYKVRVVSISDTGEEGDFDTSPTSTITIVGKSAPPSDVTSFLVNQNRDMVYFGWTAINDVDAWGYEIRRGEDWESGEFITFQQGTSFLTTDVKMGVDQSYWIKAMDTSGNYSESAKEAIVTISTIPFRNIIAEFEEDPDWLGLLANLEKVTGTLVISDGEFSGTYTAPVRDFGYVATVYIGVDVIASISTGRRFDSDSVSRFNDSATYRFTGQETLRAAGFKIRTSEDNVVWTDWQEYQPGDYYCRYFQIEMTLTRENLGDYITCSKMSYFGDLPDVDEHGTSEVIDAGSGREILFTELFHEDPSVHIEILSGTGIYVKFEDKSVTGFTVKLYDASGVNQPGSFDWHAHGI
jgi:hypothetical protein